MGHGSVGGERPPVVPDDDRIVPAPEGVVECVGITDQGADLVAAVRWDLRGSVSPQKGGDRMKSGCRESGQQEAPGVRRVGKSVKAQGKRTIFWTLIERGELKPVSCDLVLFHVELTHNPKRCHRRSRECEVLRGPAVLSVFGGSLPVMRGDYVLPVDLLRGRRPIDRRPGFRSSVAGG